MGQWDGFRVKNANICLHMFSSHFFAVFYQKNLCFYHFHFSLSLSLSLSLQQCINQSETGTGDKKNSQ